MTDYLDQKLRYTDDGKLLDQFGKPIMMEWERPIMKKVAEIIAGPAPKKKEIGKDVLNVGFGMGIVDSYIQTYAPRRHTIIEIHPDVIFHMLVNNWLKKPNVNAIFADWSAVAEFLPKYDGIFIDTWEEDFTDFIYYARNLLKPGGKLTFFNNIKEISNETKIYPPYQEVIKEFYDVEMVEIPVPHVNEDQEYWQTDWNTYYCPVLTVKDEDKTV